MSNARDMLAVAGLAGLLVGVEDADPFGQMMDRAESDSAWLRRRQRELEAERLATARRKSKPVRKRRKANKAARKARRKAR